mmetsp:Transcript_9630/g.16903  ORF Transcript_9630/g.16903 Transcript_9630/m.16903 type:complete len:89 (+) Transcript_9630:274-540(+)
MQTRSSHVPEYTAIDVEEVDDERQVEAVMALPRPCTVNQIPGVELGSNTQGGASSEYVAPKVLAFTTSVPGVTGVLELQKLLAAIGMD